MRSASQGPNPSSRRSGLPMPITSHVIVSPSYDFVGDRALRRDQLHAERHLTPGVRRAAQAWVEGADARFDAVEHRLWDFVAANVLPGDLRHRLIHGESVLA